MKGHHADACEHENHNNPNDYELLNVIKHVLDRTYNWAQRLRHTQRYQDSHKANYDGQAHKELYVDIISSDMVVEFL